MRHYDDVEWKLYKENLLDKKIYDEMQEHLFQCESCMDKFLSTIDDKEVEDAGKILSTDFTDDLMSRLESTRPRGIVNIDKYKQKKRVYNEVLLYYTAIASVAIFLMGSGFFHRMVDGIPEISRNIEEPRISMDTNKINEFSNAVLKATNGFVKSFTPSKNKEGK